MTEIDRVTRDRRTRKPVTFHDGGRKVRVLPLKFDSGNREHVETVASALGYFNFSDWRGGMRMKAQRPSDANVDGRRRAPLPRFSDLSEAWRVLNWITSHPMEHPVRVAFWNVMGGGWSALQTVEPWVLACRIMDCAFSAITKGFERGWLKGNEDFPV